MRTTISIEDSLLEDLKQRAVERGTTVSRLIEDSVRQLIAQEAEAPADGGSFELVTFGKGGQFSAFDVEKTSRLIELEDIDRFRSGA